MHINFNLWTYKCSIVHKGQASEDNKGDLENVIPVVHDKISTRFFQSEKTIMYGEILTCTSI